MSCLTKCACLIKTEVCDHGGLGVNTSRSETLLKSSAAHLRALLNPSRAQSCPNVSQAEDTAVLWLFKQPVWRSGSQGSLKPGRSSRRSSLTWSLISSLLVWKEGRTWTFRRVWHWARGCVCVACQQRSNSQWPTNCCLHYQFIKKDEKSILIKGNIHSWFNL